MKLASIIFLWNKKSQNIRLKKRKRKKEKTKQRVSLFFGKDFWLRGEKIITLTWWLFYHNLLQLFLL